MKRIISAFNGPACAGAILILGAACLGARGQTFDQLAMTPQMGWNSWNKFQGRVSEQLIRETADAMATNGMKAAGYQYVNIDDVWQATQREADGSIVPDPTRFPSGIKALADYVHSKGLKLGIYSDAGTRTCAGRPGSLDHETQDAKTYASWEVDYLKYDWCNTQGLQAPAAYQKMSDALRATGRPILFSLCEWGNSKPWTWAKGVGQSWRTTGDIRATFASVLSILDKNVNLRQYAGPGHWNDPDMLEVGNGMSVSEDRAHFTMWCMLAAPLISGNDLRNMSQETLKILTDKEVIAVNQDPLGVQAMKYSATNGLEVWFKALSDRAWAVCFLNRSQDPQKISFNWKTETVVDDVAKREAKFDTIPYRIRDVWQKQDTTTTLNPLEAEVQGHDVLLLRLDRF